MFIISSIIIHYNAKGGDSLVLHSHETSNRVLHLTLGSSAQERHGPGRVGLDEGHRSDQRTGTPVLGRKAERVKVL